jgi:hypothetical protein
MVLRLRIPPPDWKQAKCYGKVSSYDNDPWFEDMEEAQVFCNGDVDGHPCPIRDECLVFALTNNLKEGVWGGTSEVTRRVIRKRWPIQGSVPRPEWRYMSHEQALAGTSIIVSDLDDEDDDDE